MKTITEFRPADRYVYDFGACSVSKGFAQVDTSQDAHYFGMWANPTHLVIVCYCEGDVTTQAADTKEEFIKELRAIQANENAGFKGIDCMMHEPLEKAFKALGLEGMLH